MNGRRRPGWGWRLALLGLLLVPGPAAAGGPGCADCVVAGAATTILRVPAGVPLAGYGSVTRRLLPPDVMGRYPHAFWFRPSEGELEPLRVRALVLETASTRLAWVAMELVAVDRAFIDEVAGRVAALGVRPATLVISASHTHSGPGAFSRSTLIGLLALDRYDPAVRAALVESAADAVRRADAAREPARIGAASVTVPGLTWSRLGQPLDDEMVVIKITGADGAPLAALWNYAIHGTMLGPGNRRLSGDVMGTASAELERDLGAPVLYVNGAVADVSPQGRGEEAVARVGRELAVAARTAWARAQAVPTGTLAVRHGRIALPEPVVPLRNCVAAWLPAAAVLPIGDTLPRDAELIAGVIGDTAWVTIPGELQTALGVAIKAAGHERWRHAFVAGVSNDYLGYFVTPADYRRPGYVSCATLHGAEAGERLRDAAIDLLRGLNTRRLTAASGCATSPGPGAAARR